MQRVEEDPGRVFQEEGRVGEAEGLRVGPGEGKRSAQGRLAVSAHI